MYTIAIFGYPGPLVFNSPDGDRQTTDRRTGDSMVAITSERERDEFTPTKMSDLENPLCDRCDVIRSSHWLVRLLASS